MHLFIKLIAASLLCLISVSAEAQGRFVAFGDSITQGAGLLGIGPSYWPYLRAIVRGFTLVNNAVSGAQAADQARQIYFGYSPSIGDSVGYLIGSNDQWKYQTAGQFAQFGSTLGAELYYLAETTANMQTCSRSGTWSTNAPYTPGLVSTAPGSSLTCSFTGALLTFGYEIQDGVAGTFSVMVDGVSVGTFQTQSSASIATQNGKTWAPALGRIPLSVGGPHAVTFMMMGGSNVYLDWIGQNSVSPTHVYISTIPYQTPAGFTATGGSAANVNTVNSYISSIAIQATADGFAVGLGNGNATVNPNADLLSDGLHPNAQGQVNLSAAFAAAGF